jgi:hypothetical protein
MRGRALAGGVFIMCLGAFLTFVVPRASYAQSNSGIIQGIVTDPSKAVVPGAKVRAADSVSGRISEAKTAMDGTFELPNLTLSRYHLTVSAPGFSDFAQDVDVHSAAPVSLSVVLTMAQATTNITVTGSAPDLIEVTPTEHTGLDRTPD